MKRVLVIGNCGAGKTTLALKLGGRLNLPVYHLDQLWWRPGWQNISREEFDLRLAEWLKQDYWIIDGDYSRTLPERLKYADTVIFLDFPSALCLWRCIKRICQWHGKRRPDMAEGCPERLDWHFLHYVWCFRQTQTPKLEAALQNFAGKVIRLNSPRAVAEFEAGKF